MENNKILTIAIPTYNRGFFLEQSLERITSQIKGLEDEIELLVSDNCSSDNTQQVVKKFIDAGAPIVYNRNNVNLGMDGNFVYCFKNAKAKYAWILGDDDYLVEGTIPKLLNIMKSGEYGLIHLNNSLDNDLGSKVFTEKSKFVGDISFMITFISANIVQTKYVKQVDFNKYIGTYFTLIPVYLTAVIEENKNMMVYFDTMDAPADASTNGGYNIFKVFVTNYLNIVKEFRSSLGYRYYEIEKYKLCRLFIYPWMVKLLIKSNHGLHFKTNSWFKIIFKKYWYEPYFYPMLLLFWIRRIKNNFS